ncbi:hypothetical protein PIB30_005954 [Stylosanthes scabra]|uniref:Uncharacterized protein n=1 Tax=Stylosanthes scabra TaxID=79078 RepID=A0ABU6S4P8_9FABA|nr:hypothetical protein [Stylosanthes scabra]
MQVTHCDRQAEVFTVDELEETEGYGVVRFRVNLRVGQNVDPMYSAESVFNVYRVEFPPIPDEQFWPKWHGTTVRPNPSMQRQKRGRPVSTRIRNGMILSSLLNPRGVVYAGRKVTPRRSVRTQHQRVEHKKFGDG